jgi:hypothetical protein
VASLGFFGTKLELSGANFEHTIDSVGELGRQHNRQRFAKRVASQEAKRITVCLKSYAVSARL